MNFRNEICYYFIKTIYYMKKTTILSLGLLLGLFSISQNSIAQKVFSCNYKSEADIKVFVSKYKSDADLIVYKCKYKSDASGNNGLWYFVNYKSDADKKIFFTDYKSDADLIIYFSDYKSDAEWKNSSKKQLLL